MKSYGVITRRYRREREGIGERVGTRNYGVIGEKLLGEVIEEKEKV